MPQATHAQQVSSTQQLPVQMRAAELVPSTYNEAENSIEVVWTEGARVRRYDWYNDTPYEEELAVTPDAVDMTRFDAGTVQVLNNHMVYGDVSAILGVATRGWIEGGQGRAVLRLSQRPEVAGLIADIRSGIIRSISFGYSVQRYEITRAQDRTDGVNMPLYRATRWTPQEISFVTVPADPGASTRAQPTSSQASRGDAHGGTPCEFVRAAAHTPQEPTMPQTAQTTEGGATPDNTTATRAQPGQPE
uniref:HK97 family phage prohead protease n=1 Tax=Paracidovorax wautersii TaxID=1177982 RepID=UPI0031DD3BF6